MADMGSTKGFDPMPPDQYLYFLGKKEPPLQRLLALVRSLTIQRGRRSPYCVDERGKEMRPADLERALQMEHGNFNRALREAVGRGLIRIGRGGPSESRSTHNSRHPQRVYLCGSVEESKGYKEGEENGGVCTDPLRFLSPSQRKVYAGWRNDQQERFYAEFDSAVNYKLQVEREAIALARHIGDRALDQVFAAHALPKNRLATEPPTSRLLQLTLVAGAPQQNGSVQTRSVPTRASESVPTTKRESVPSGASLLPSEKTEIDVESVGRSTPKEDRLTDEAALEAEVKAALKREWAAQLPLDSPTPRLIRNVMAGLRGAPVALLAERMRQRRLSATGYGFAVVLANDVGIAWMEAAERRLADQAAANQREAEHLDQNRKIWRATLTDPKASDEEKALARELLAEKASAAGGAS